MRRPRGMVLCGLGLLACGGEPDTGTTDGRDLDAASPRGYEPPVVTNAESPVRYPPSLFRARVEGTVVLRLFLTAEGEVVTDSTRIAESSGHAGLDSAALEGVGRMQFAPARRDGAAVASGFLQPVHFRHPAGASVQENP